MPPKRPDDLIPALRVRLEAEIAGGADFLPRVASARNTVSGAGSGTGSGSEAGAETRTPKRLPIHPAVDTPLGKVCAEALGCTRCGLSTTRKQVVFGVGNPRSPLMFVGEAPGADEDAQGEPFVGRAGQLLTRLLAEVKLSRQEVYIANILKCRPPGNRPPAPDEIAQCTPWLTRQVELIRPRILCALGNFALQFFLGPSARITRMRGRFYPKDDLLVFPTFHPSYLLRGGEDMPLARQDFRALAEKYREFVQGTSPEVRPSQ